MVASQVPKNRVSNNQQGQVAWFMVGWSDPNVGRRDYRIRNETDTHCIGKQCIL